MDKKLARNSFEVRTGKNAVKADLNFSKKDDVPTVLFSKAEGCMKLVQTLLCHT